MKPYLFILLLFLFANLFSTDDYYQKGMRLIENQEYRMALDYFNSIPKNDSVQLKILECKYYLRQYNNFEYDINQLIDKSKPSYFKEDVQILKLQYLTNLHDFPRAIIYAKHYQPKEVYFQGLKSLALGTIFLRKNEFQKSEDYYKQALEKLASVKQKNTFIHIGMIYNNLAIIHYYQADYQKSRNFYQKAKEQYLKFPKQTAIEMAMVNYNLAIICVEEGKYEEATSLVNSSLNIYQKKYGNEHQKIGECYSILGNIYMEKGELDKALDYFIRDINISEKIYGKEHIESAYAYFDCGTVYNILKDYQQAEQYLLKALDVRKKHYGEYNKEISDNYLELATNYIEQKKYSAAKELCKKVLKIETKLGIQKSERIATIAYNYGLIAKANKNYIVAENNFLSAFNIYSEVLGNKNAYKQEIYLHLADLKSKQENYKAAFQYILNSFPEDKKNIQETIFSYLKFLEIQYKKDQRRHLIDIKKYEKYISTLLLLTKQLTAQTFEYIGEKSKLNEADLLSQISAIAIPIISQLYQQEKNNKYLDWTYFFIENNKANVLLNNRNNKKNEPKQLIKKIEQTISDISYLQEKTTTNSSQIHSLQNELFELKKQYEQNLKKQNNLNYLGQQYTIGSLQQTLDKQTIFLNYFSHHGDYYLLAITQNDCDFYKLSIEDNELKQLLESIQSIAYNKELATKITQKIIPELLLNNRKKIIVSADGMIRNIPFDALMYHHQFLIKELAIYHTFSGRIYCSDHKKKSSENKNILCIAPDYTNSIYTPLQNIQEVNTIKNSLSTKALIKEEATIYNYYQYKNDVKIIHFSAHTQTDSLIPMFSAIIFQPDSTQNYFLRINEILQQTIVADLVTLSICSSGFGKTNFGEGVLNFGWAFHYAGAKEILITNWATSDKAANIIMKDFYNNIRHHNSYESAIRNAKLNYLKSTDAIGVEPYFWSNYILYSTYSKENNYIKYLFFTLTLLVLIPFSIYLNKKTNAVSH